MPKSSDHYTELDTLRHSCAHLMAHAIKTLYPNAKFGVGPAIENGFYYDIDLDVKLTEEDLKTIEAKMKEIASKNHPFVRNALKRDEALKYFSERNENYKLDIINQIDPKDEISTYSEGDFIDLCRGPHIESAGQIKHFKLLSISGAYWRGNETNAMMQRIYGTCFTTEKELKTYLYNLEEAKKRDHRKIGKDLDLFSVQEEAGQGLIFYHPKGAIIRYLIEQFIREEHLKRGYKFVVGPQILKSDIWKISGHYYYYKENMFLHEAEDGKEYGIKPMNCPGHMLIYGTQTRSYRDLPLKFFEMGNVCRNEKSGALHGLLRVRNFTQDDAHIFCLPEQLQTQIREVLDFVFEILKTFGFEDFEIELSTRPKESIGSDEMWDKATTALKGALEEKNLKFGIAQGGGAFYGPKIDVRIKDALGRAWQCSTIQCDFALPEAFKLQYVAASGSKERPVMIHRAILGSVERFMGTLIEHYAGAMPLWLSPVQIALLPVSEKHMAYAQEWASHLIDKKVRIEVLEPSETLGKRIRLAETQKIPYILIVGDKEVESQTVTVRKRSTEKQEALRWTDFIERCTHEIQTQTNQ